MAFSYKPLWIMLTNFGITKTQFRERLNFSTSTLAKLSSDKLVSMEILEKICKYFNCNLDNVVMYVSDVDQFFKNISDEILGYSYTFFIDKYPECKIQLKPSHMNFCSNLSKHEFDSLILKCELIANEKNFPNAGIIDTTKCKLDYKNGMIIFNGSFAVVEEFMGYLITNVK